MKFLHKIEISENEYCDKRYEIARSLLANVVTRENIDSLNEAKVSASIIFNCISLSDSLLKELGYYYKTKNAQKDETSVHSLSDLLKKE
jgi:predicted metal-binding transcription factor (methanogenesis marker protein 9)